MASPDDERERPHDPSEPARGSLLWRGIVLAVAFLLLAIVGVVTVAVPELSDDGDEDGETRAASGDEAEARPPEAPDQPPAADPPVTTAP